jgi:hypothetical protein
METICGITGVDGGSARSTVFSTSVATVDRLQKIVMVHGRKSSTSSTDQSETYSILNCWQMTIEARPQELGPGT